MKAPEKWTAHYAAHGSNQLRYPTEWVVRTLAGGNYPDLKMDKSHYAGARILDMGCGDGRNLGLLQDLGFEVHAVEISEAMVRQLEEAAGTHRHAVQFAVGRNESLPYAAAWFDYMLCCSSCYYLEGDMTWAAVRKELARVLKPGGFLIANFPDEKNAVLRNAVRLSDGSMLITNDPFSIRDGSRFVAAAASEDLEALLVPEFRLVGAVGSPGTELEFAL